MRLLIARTVVSLLLAITIAACGSAAFINREPFNENAWRLGDKRTRGTMSFSLHEGGKVKGMSKQSVETLLGKPDTNLNNAWIYAIDTKIPTDIWFTVHFENDVAISTDIGD